VIAFERGGGFFGCRKDAAGGQVRRVVPVQGRLQQRRPEENQSVQSQIVFPLNCRRIL
jgi:hypothetical protein